MTATPKTPGVYHPDEEVLRDDFEYDRERIME
jgi:hypothetical protein